MILFESLLITFETCIVFRQLGSGEKCLEIKTKLSKTNLMELSLSKSVNYSESTIHFWTSLELSTERFRLFFKINYSFIKDATRHVQFEQFQNKFCSGPLYQQNIRGLHSGQISEGC